MSSEDLGREVLTGWGRTAPSGALVVHPASDETVVQQIAAAPSRGVLARGLGRSYGDSAQNAGGLVLDMTGMDRLLELDPVGGIARVEAGCSIDQLARVLLPAGWFLPVTPGTRFVTIGGAIAADVHGKNHHHDGTLGSYVESLDIALADMTVRRVSPQEDPELFWATVGGLGLTGVILRAVIRLVRVSSAWMLVSTERCSGLDDVLAALEGADRHKYSVAWIDLLSQGRAAGRGVVTAADHAPAAALTDIAPDAVRTLPPSSRVRVPGWAPPRLLNRTSIGAFNSAWFHGAPRHRVAQQQRLGTYFHPLDSVAGWNRLYGRRGMVQYQCVVPDEAALRRILHRVRAAGVPSFLAVLKRLGPANQAPLSFPRPGWTLAFDVPTGSPGVGRLLDELDELVACLGGAVYLAKDSRMRPELMTTFYPRLAEWLEVRARVDPLGMFRSDQARRLMGC